MTEQNLSVLRLLRMGGPIVMFLAVMGIGVYVLEAPLVLVVVVACLFTVIEWTTLTWILRRSESS